MTATELGISKIDAIVIRMTLFFGRKYFGCYCLVALTSPLAQFLVQVLPNPRVVGYILTPSRMIIENEICSSTVAPNFVHLQLLYLRLSSTTMYRVQL